MQISTIGQDGCIVNSHFFCMASPAFAVSRELYQPIIDIGNMNFDKVTMHELEALSLPEVKRLSTAEIRKMREKAL